MVSVNLRYRYNPIEINMMITEIETVIYQAV